MKAPRFLTSILSAITGRGAHPQLAIIGREVANKSVDALTVGVDQAYLRAFKPEALAPFERAIVSGKHNFPKATLGEFFKHFLGESVRSRSKTLQFLLAAQTLGDDAVYAVWNQALHLSMSFPEIWDVMKSIEPLYDEDPQFAELYESARMKLQNLGSYSAAELQMMWVVLTPEEQVKWVDQLIAALKSSPGGGTFDQWSVVLNYLTEAAKRADALEMMLKRTEHPADCERLIAIAPGTDLAVRAREAQARIEKRCFEHAVQLRAVQEQEQSAKALTDRSTAAPVKEVVSEPVRRIVDFPATAPQAAGSTDDREELTTASAQ